MFAKIENGTLVSAQRTATIAADKSITLSPTDAELLAAGFKEVVYTDEEGGKEVYTEDATHIYVSHEATEAEEGAE